MLKFIHKLSWFQLFAILLFFGIFLRLSAFENWGFGFDQVQIIEEAKKISIGNLTLIGPRTGPASLFTGPLIYYLAAFFYKLGLSYYSLIATTIFIAIITCLTIYFLLKKYFNYKFAFYGVFLWAFSYSLIKNDQVTWNPNLTILASSLLFFSLLSSLNKKVVFLDYLLVFLGSFLAYQAHFSGFIFLPFSVLFFLSNNKKQALKLFLASTFGFIFSLLPTILFDYRNNWLNLNGFLNFFSELALKDRSAYSMNCLWKSFYTTFESFGNLFFGNFYFPIQALFIIGLLVFCFYIYLFLFNKKNLDKKYMLPIFWILIVTCIFSFYDGDKPAYYFLIQTPAILIIYIYLYDSFKNRYDTRPLIIIFVILAFVNSFVTFFNFNSFSLINGLKIKEYIYNQSMITPVNKIVFHLSSGNEFGLKYLLNDLQTGNPNGSDWYLSYPNKVTFKEKAFNGIDIWSQVLDKDKEILYFNDEFRIKTPHDIFVYRDEYYSGIADQAYIVIQNGNEIALIQKYKVNSFNQKFTDFVLQNNNRWTMMNNQNATWYYKPTESVFLLTSESRVDSIYENVQIF